LSRCFKECSVLAIILGSSIDNLNYGEKMTTSELLEEETKEENPSEKRKYFSVINEQKQLAILIVDDSSEDRDWYKRMLKNGEVWDCSFREAETGQLGLELCQGWKPDCIILDYVLPDFDGLEFLSRLKEINYSGLVIFLTGQGSEKVASEAIKKGVQGYFIKSLLTLESLIKTINNGIKNVRLKNSQILLSF
jgi:CheY-like chemotaxis protein